MRTDEVYKHVIRKVFKSQRKLFHQYFVEVTEEASYRHTAPEELETILVRFLEEKKQYKLKEGEINTAKRIFLNFLGRKQLKKIEAVHTGTRKAVLALFNSAIARQLIYPQFRQALLGVTSLCSERVGLHLRETMIRLEGIQSD